MTVKFAERNEALYNDWKLYKAGKMAKWELIAKYKISSTRIDFLINQMRIQDVMPRPDDQD